MGGQGEKRRRDKGETGKNKDLRHDGTKERQIGKDKDVRQKTERDRDKRGEQRRVGPQARPDGTREVNGVEGVGL